VVKLRHGCQDLTAERRQPTRGSFRCLPQPTSSCFSPLTCYSQSCERLPHRLRREPMKPTGKSQACIVPALMDQVL
ncbi:hypothetical protein KUCAC02_025438, partial [Chaenocephalus aceratus]